MACGRDYVIVAIAVVVLIAVLLPIALIGPQPGLVNVNNIYAMVSLLCLVLPPAHLWY